jgi:hypothetical protein
MRCVLHILSVYLLTCVLMVAGVSAAPAAKSLATVQSVKVTTTPGGVSVEIATSQPVPLRSQVITDPDRLILDFPNSKPAGDLRTKLLNQGEIKGYRVARFSENPPTTRVVIDLKSPQHYQIFPDGTTVIVKLMSDQQQAALQARLNNVSYTPPPPAQPVSRMEVHFANGRLSISAERASLDQILKEVQRQTGTEITVPPGAAQEQIVTNIGPLPIREALVSLLNGSRFNFIMVDSEREPGKLKSVILSYRGNGGVSQPAIAAPPPPVTQSEPDPQTVQEAPPEMQPQPEGPGQQETNPPAQEAPPPQ